ncbi:hypothetical protein [Roseivirga sp.]|uniref:hypothetical protein n=1 Tax=Roseivirga sp. TaxID=1964215 RepID=UPI003B52CCDA
MENLPHISIEEIGEEWPEGTYLTEIPTLPLARQLLGPDDDAIRKIKSRYYYDELPNQARTRLRLGKHDRGEEYLIADGKIHDGDADGHRRHLPLHVKVIRYKNYSLEAGEVLDVTSSATYWPGLHFREELYVYMNIDRLVVKPGAKIMVRGNVFILDCQKIIFEGHEEQNQESFAIHILGTAHAAYGSIRNSPGEAGQDGLNGQNGIHGSPLIKQGSLLGPVLLPGKGSPDGTDGEDGTDGTNGSNGQNGGMSMLADIRIGQLSHFEPGMLQIFGQASTGLPGGDGGKGGNGGHGGNGADGIDGHPGGKAGKGGNAGQGGNGGFGGNGGLSSNIFVQLPTDYHDCLQLISKDSEGGEGGKAGEAGEPGLAGSNGDYSSAPLPSNGLTAQPGKAGRKGRGRQGPSIVLVCT